MVREDDPAHSVELVVLVEPQVALALGGGEDVLTEPLSLVVSKLAGVDVSVGVPGFAETVPHVVLELTKVFPSEGVG